MNNHPPTQNTYSTILHPRPDHHSSLTTDVIHQALKKTQTKHTIKLSLPESVFGKVK